MRGAGYTRGPVPAPGTLGSPRGAGELQPHRLLSQANSEAAIWGYP